MFDYQIRNPVELYNELDKLICYYTQYEDPGKLKNVNDLIEFIWELLTEEEKLKIIHS